MEKNFKITDRFNYVSRNKQLNSYAITLTRPQADFAAQAQAEGFAETLARWLMNQGDDFKGNAKKPQAITAEGGNARVALEATEETMARIERQFASGILRADPPAEHARGAIYPPKADPFDISKW